MNQQITQVYEQFAQASTDEEYRLLKSQIEVGGYSFFSKLLEGIKQQIKISKETELPIIKSLIRKGESLVPNPVKISPSWIKVWSDCDRLIQFKEEAMRQVPLDEREGEWQIMMNNPFTNDGISCYPSLSFMEAAFLYAYFRLDLKKNEYIRMQKIINLVETQGN